MIMNNKQIGTAFERRICELLKNHGYWVHFIAPDSRGSQPFDIIAVKDGMAAAIECKTLDATKKYFSIDRLEENQRMAFDYWLACGNLMPLIYVEYGEEIKIVEWSDLKEKGKVEMR